MKSLPMYYLETKGTNEQRPTRYISTVLGSFGQKIYDADLENRCVGFQAPAETRLPRNFRCWEDTFPGNST